ncbi:hypothetical protein EDB80DRAFT_714555 [Ilyonectria destructans]|nr:hypothetical protein EDB80DRAFT_714555 [Ilyonectria destructans]
MAFRWSRRTFNLWSASARCTSLKITPRPYYQHGLRSLYTMPAEWELHSQTITVWPDFASIPDEKTLQAARLEVSAIANAVAQFEPVTMYTQHRNVKMAQGTVSQDVKVVGLEASQLWVRDTGPVFVKDVRNGQALALSMNFNYWGGKLPREGDETAADKIASTMSIPVFTAPFQAEGGGIEVDGEGTLLATESSIINSNRNPGLSKQQLEDHFSLALGVKKTVWLPGIRDYDITDYHIDALARFLRPGTVLLGKPPANAEAEVISAYEEARRILSQETDSHGRAFQIEEILEPDLSKIPGEHFGETGETVASYVNYLVVNGGLIVPRFGVGDADDEALQCFRELFPSRQVVQVDINTLPKLGGGIHCATQQVPAI